MRCMNGHLIVALAHCDISSSARNTRAVDWNYLLGSNDGGCAASGRGGLHLACALDGGWSTRGGGGGGGGLFVCFYLKNKCVDDRLFKELQLAPTPHDGNFQVLAATFDNFKESSHSQLENVRMDGSGMRFMIVHDVNEHK